MLWVGLGLYWIICGFAAVSMGGPSKDLWVDGIVFAFGGFVVPARAIVKLIS